jgi:tetratricopeptide (TPR) repeat protein
MMRTLYTSLSTGFLLGALCVSQLWAADDNTSISREAFQPVHADLISGKADDAIARLNTSLATNPNDAEAHNLLCRVYYQEERWDDAIRECQAAVKLMPADSNYHLWLGRADGEKADSIHSIKAFGLAKKVRDEFERSVQLDGTNVDALSDLGEFYTEAPGIVGGGKQKAQGVVQTLERYGPVQAHQLKGRLAEKDKNYAAAEAEFKAGVDASNQSANAWMDLASYYARRRQWSPMLDALHSGIDADAKAAEPHGPALVDAADLLIRSGQDPQLAIQLLRLYLSSPNKSADSPAFQAHAKLSRLLDQQGDHESARQEGEAATALAHEYHSTPPKLIANKGSQ